MSVYHSNSSFNDIVINPNIVHDGAYKGKKWNDLALFELKDIMKNADPKSILYQTAQHILQKRDTLNSYIDVSYHAVNRFSARFVDEYINGRMRFDKDYEGIVNYLSRMALKALKCCPTEPNSEGKIIVPDGNKKFVFIRLRTGIPRLITIIPND